MIFLLICLNVAIAWWNCYAVGSVWRDTKAFGSTFDKALAYSAAIQSIAGFSVPILLGLTWLATAYLQTGDTPSEPETIAAIWQGVFSFWYLAVIIPVVGSGFIIWGHSMKVAYQRRDFGSIATASWNTFAQAHNTIGMINNLGPVGDAFAGAMKNKDLAVPALVIGLVLVSLLGSVLITVLLIQHYSRKTDARVDQMARMQSRA